jgi:hypothetical protein
VFHPDPAVDVIARVDVNLVVASHPVSVLIMARHPDSFFLLRNPFPLDFPMAQWFMDHGWMVDMLPVRPMGRDNRRECPVFEEIVEGYRSESDGKTLPPSSLHISRIRDRGDGQSQQHNQSDQSPSFHGDITSSSICERHPHARLAAFL